MSQDQPSGTTSWTEWPARLAAPDPQDSAARASARRLLRAVLYGGKLVRRVGRKVHLLSRLPRSIPQWRLMWKRFLRMVDSLHRPDWNEPALLAELLHNNRITPAEAARLADHLARARPAWLAPGAAPLFSVLVDVPDERHTDPLIGLIRALREQVWPAWELVVALPAGVSPPARIAADARVRFVAAPSVGPASDPSPDARRIDALNAAATVARGRMLIVLSAGDVPQPGMLLDLAEAVVPAPFTGPGHADLPPDAIPPAGGSAATAAPGPQDGAPDLVFGDELVTDAGGVAIVGRFKPGVSPETLLSADCVGRPAAVRAEWWRRLGGLRAGTGAAAERDLVLRLAEHTTRWAHVPGPGLLRRAASAADLAPADAGKLPPVAAPTDGDMRRVVQDAVARRGLDADVEPLPGNARAWGGPAFRLRFRTRDRGRVSILIPTRDGMAVLGPCVRSVLERTAYPDFEILVLDNGSREPDTLAFLASLRPPHRVVPVADGPGGFSYSAVNNAGAAAAKGRFLVLLNNDTEVLDPRWLDDLIGHLCLPGTGVAGARLLYPEGTLQHAGVVVDVCGGNADHVHRFLPAGQAGRDAGAACPRNSAAVTGACLAVHADLWRRLGGLDAGDLRVAYSDVMLCLDAARREGMRTVYVPQAELLHRESWSRGPLPDFAEVRGLSRRILRTGDPHYNPTYWDTPPYFSIRTRRRARPATWSGPVRVAAAWGADALPDRSPGAADLRAALAGQGRIRLVADAPTHGGTSPGAGGAGPADRWTPRSWFRRKDATGRRAAPLPGGADVLLAVGLGAWPEAEAACAAGAPVVWWLPGCAEPFVQPRGLPRDVWSSILWTAGEVCRVVFDSHAARGAFAPWAITRNREMIHPGIDPTPGDAARAAMTPDRRAAVRAAVGCAADAVLAVFADPPTTAPATGFALRVARSAHGAGRPVHHLLLPQDGSPAAAAWCLEVARHAARENVRLTVAPRAVPAPSHASAGPAAPSHGTAEPGQPSRWELLAAADVAILDDEGDPAPRFVLEARATSLAVFAGFGTCEGVVDDRRGRTFPTGDARAPADLLREHADRQEVLADMGRQGRMWVESLAILDEQAARFADLLCEAAELRETTV